MIYRLTTTVTTSSSVFVAPTCANQSIGASCNLSSDPCAMSQPCLNLAKCYPNISLPLGYLCSCVAGFEGVHCEIDNRACRPDSTCLYGGVCNTTSNVTSCICPTGKTGDQCQYTVDVCANISCQNDAQCISTYGNWSCLCTNTEIYSGTYCQIKSSSLRMKEMVSRSFAGIAIGCIATVLGFVFIMDILKYFLNIDPVGGELRSVRKKRERQKQKTKTIKQPGVVVRFQYIHA